MHRISANGANIPAIGLGTWTLRDEAASQLVKSALETGYRHVDTAAMYENEVAVGAGLRASGLAREEIFLTTKVWPTEIAEGDLQRSVEASLKRLAVDYLDLVLIHWPSKTIPLAESIRALNEVRDQGWARNIGVSNFTSPLIEEAVTLSKNPLACNQVEYHPFLNQSRVMAACQKHGMALVSYCPLARGSDLFDLPEIAAPAQIYGKTPAQVVLRWHIQQEGVIAIPRSSNAARVRQNFEVFDFELSAQEMNAISALRARNHRICDFEFSPDWDRV